VVNLVRLMGVRDGQRPASRTWLPCSSFRVAAHGRTIDEVDGAQIRLVLALWRHGQSSDLESELPYDIGTDTGASLLPAPAGEPSGAGSRGVQRGREGEARVGMADAKVLNPADRRAVAAEGRWVWDGAGDERGWARNGVNTRRRRILDGDHRD
jgi:hypothetical protein